MADRALWVRIKADPSGLIAGMARASQAAKDFDKDLVKNAQKRQALEQLGTAYRNVAIGAGAGLVAVVKSAMDWETAWAGVTKTVDGSEAELSALEGRLREMARTMPATHQEIAAVAEAAGQLGVALPDVAGFTEVMIQLGETTNLTADEAATSLAQLMNVMQTAPEDVDNLGAALVALGNDGASTERDIVQMAQNIAGAGKTIGLSEADVLGIANALASVGIEAEAGGTSVSKIFIDMAKAAKMGSKDLTTWAEVVGVSRDRFKQLMADDPAVAFTLFTKGLGRINKEGGNVFKLLEDLGQTDARVTKALLGMANSGDLLKDSLDLGADAMENGTALTDEYAKRAETSAAKVQVAWNGIKDNLIDIGSDALPVVVELADAVSTLTGAFSDLPKPVQGGMLKMLAYTAALAGGMYTINKFRTGIATMAENLEASGKAAEGAGRKYALMRGGATAAGIGLLSFASAAEDVDPALGVASSALGAAAIGFGVGGPWGLAIGAGIGLLKGFGDANRVASVDVDKLTASLDQQTGSLTANSAEQLKSALQEGKAFANARQLGIDPGQVVDAVMGDSAAQSEMNLKIREYIDLRQQALDVASEARAKLDGSDQNAVNEADEQIRKASEALDDARAAADALNESMTEQDGKIGEARQKWQDYTDVQRQSIEANRLSTEQVKAVNEAVKGLPAQVATQLTTPGYEGALNNILDLQYRYKLTPDQVETMMRALNYTGPQIDAVLKAMAEVDGTDARPTINVNAGNSFSIIDGIQRSINNLTGKTVAVRVVQKGSTPGGIVKDAADGAVFKYFADGGHENHVAQMAPAGAWRIWAEPETKGESYIPHAPEKRQRSLQIWAETGKILGVQGFANGGVSGGGGLDGSTELVARLMNPTIKVEKNGMTKLIDDRVQIGVARGIAGNNRFEAANRRARGGRRKAPGT